MAELPAFWPTRRRWLGLAGRHGQRRAPADGADVAANLPGLVRVKSVRRLPPGGRDPLAGVGGLGQEKKLWRVVVGRARCGHRGYLVDPRRGHEVPQSHLGIEASGVLEVDRYSGYKARTPVKNGSLQCALGAWATRLCGRGQSTRGHPALPPWNVSGERRVARRAPASVPSAPNTSCHCLPSPRPSACAPEPFPSLEKPRPGLPLAQTGWPEVYAASKALPFLARIFQKTKDLAQQVGRF